MERGESNSPHSHTNNLWGDFPSDWTWLQYHRKLESPPPAPLCTENVLNVSCRELTVLYAARCNYPFAFRPVTDPQHGIGSGSDCASGKRSLSLAKRSGKSLFLFRLGLVGLQQIVTELSIISVGEEVQHQKRE